MPKRARHPLEHVGDDDDEGLETPSTAVVQDSLLGQIRQANEKLALAEAGISQTQTEILATEPPATVDQLTADHRKALAVGRAVLTMQAQDIAREEAIASNLLARDLGAPVSRRVGTMSRWVRTMGELINHERRAHGIDETPIAAPAADPWSELLDFIGANPQPLVRDSNRDQAAATTRADTAKDITADSYVERVAGKATAGGKA